MDFKLDPRFKGIQAFSPRVLLASPTMHGEELKYMAEAYHSGWMTTAGGNIDRLEEEAAGFVGVKYAVALSSGTAALHLAVKLAAEKIYNSSSGVSTPDGLGAGGSLYGRRVFCSDMTFSATVNPVLYEGGEPVFIDTEEDTWNMDPAALEKAFVLYPDVRIVILAHLYGTPAKAEEIRDVCRKHQALLIEDAAESLGASCVVSGTVRQTGGIGDYGVVSFNGNKIITGSSGGMLFVNDAYSAGKARKWSTQSREPAPWYEHEELGYNYRISNVAAGVVCGQWLHLKEHIESKKKIYDKYQQGLADLPVTLNPYDDVHSSPNFWLSCMMIDSDAVCESIRSEYSAVYRSKRGQSCPTEILEALQAFNAEGRPIWKPMHLQPIYRNNAFITVQGNGRAVSNAYDESGSREVSADLFHRGLCLPSDIKMTEEQQEIIIEIVKRCFK